MKGMLFTFAATAALLFGGLVATPTTAEARPVRGWYYGYRYRPYYYSAPRPFVYRAPAYYNYGYPRYYYARPGVYVGPRPYYYYRYW